MANQWRAKEWKQSGSVASPVVPNTDPLPAKSRTTSTSVTVGTAPVEQEISLNPQKSSLPADSTGSSSLLSMGWTLSPQRVIESPWLLLEMTKETPLSEEMEKELRELASNMALPLDELLNQIATYYVEQEAEIAEIGTMQDAIELYMTNEVI